MGWTGGDPGTRRRSFLPTPAALVRGMRGGLPPQRPDQNYMPPAFPAAPGSAAGSKFRRLIVGGPGPGAGVFVYNGVPGPTTLVASLVGPLTTKDPFNTPVVPELAIYGSGGRILQLAVSGGIPLETFFTGSANEAQPAQIKAGIAGSLLQFILAGPTDTTSADSVFIDLEGTPHGTPNLAKGYLSYVPPAGGNQHMISWGGDGVFRATNANMVGAVPLRRGDIFERDVNTAGIHDFTVAYSIPAGDVVAGMEGTAYEIEAEGIGSWPNPGLTGQITLDMWGSNSLAINPITFSAAFIPAGHGFQWYAKVTVKIITVGAAGVADALAYGFISFVDVSASTSAQIWPLNNNGKNFGAGVPFTTAPTSMALAWQWGGAPAGGGTFQCFSSEFTRKGP